MLYRNVLAMEIEEMIRSHPLDGVVLMATGCSTNAVVRLIAVARREGVDLTARRSRRARPGDTADRQCPPRGQG